MAAKHESSPSEDTRTGFQEIFEIKRVHNSPIRGHAARKDSDLPGLISCTMPFTLVNDRTFVAIGCSEGIWVADPKDPDFLHRVMDIKGVSEISLIEEYYLLLVLADKVLYCFSLDALDPYNNSVRIPQKLSTTPVDFFRIGVWAGSLAVICKKKGMKESVFRMLEPMLGVPPPTVPDPVVATFGPDRTYWFRFHKEFYVPIDCTDVVFLKTTLAIVHPQGFEILDLQTMSTVTVPPKDDPRSKTLIKRCKGSKPLGLFRGKDGKHLLCYSTFGLFVNRHGDPLHDLVHVIDWHGTVYAVVPAAPYVVLFKARSIEVRRGDSGRLEQVLFGNGMRCSWRGPKMLQGELDEYDPTPHAHRPAMRLQVVMNAPHGMGSDEVAQHVYDLVPKEAPLSEKEGMSY